jgi:hypothetical protein
MGGCYSSPARPLRQGAGANVTRHYQRHRQMCKSTTRITISRLAFTVAPSDGSSQDVICHVCPTTLGDLPTSKAFCPNLSLPDFDDLSEDQLAGPAFSFVCVCAIFLCCDCVFLFWACFTIKVSFFAENSKESEARVCAQNARFLQHTVVRNTCQTRYEL